MGTRHIQRVITKAGQVKVAQYGQWDGYPDGQGVDILEYLHNGNLDKYQENLEKIPVVTEAQIVDVNKVNWQKEYPYLSRDCGSNIHQMIENGEVKFVQLTTDKEATQWCEGFYEINFQEGFFEAEYYGTLKRYQLDNLPTKEQFLKDFV